MPDRLFCGGLVSFAQGHHVSKILLYVSLCSSVLLNCVILNFFQHVLRYLHSQNTSVGYIILGDAHTSHVCGHLPLCVHWCTLRLNFCVNYYTHHVYMDAVHYVCIDTPSETPPMWMIYCIYHMYMDAVLCVCISSDNPSVRTIYDTYHMYICTLICVHWCTSRIDCPLNALLHTSQVNGCSPLCMRWCSFRLRWYLYDLLHISYYKDALHHACADVPSG